MALADQLLKEADDGEQNLSQKAYETILNKIISREFAVNTVLQERRLAEMLDISRTPVRNALNRLENEGFIARNGGRTPVVKEFSIQELIETLHIRRVLEAEATRLATGKIPLSELDAIQTLVEGLLIKKVPDTEEDWAADSRIHETIAFYSGNKTMADYIKTLRLKTHMFNLSEVPERFEAGHREHLQIIQALRDNQPDLAQSLVAAHIDNVRQGIIKRLSQF
ncbi:GntR family transcriptional regulator [Erwiniaceae bacterium L1_54_6]|jgi:DNA-binding GntR family transcriptional regulator|uniref:GntR family transcriptional regulator n=1 Tax=Pantoea cypripedii TaxID=55209 RepID=A0A1X1EKE4_PANCY|nr:MULTISPECIES: GntR family transcriptional regulator [Pantoea]MDF7660763.1 GntR family transcriptional regulator [Erwiniaceae bacterium L1_54_6]MBP2198924.1 DNA-binding GntR family transcriptional regulator [Pantoea cypripedii]MDE1185372.1 GntR family transcriptional regulator [Pantoea sp.]ORM89366.1 GntR family transcriptional regulator [Pantoea cypripedii]QGY32394.1 GntR family transcriptional regulator [Pantoea cypripedii]